MIKKIKSMSKEKNDNNNISTHNEKRAAGQIVKGTILLIDRGNYIKDTRQRIFITEDNIQGLGLLDEPLTYRI